MPGLLKVGMTTAGVDNRVVALSTGVPEDFIVERVYTYPAEMKQGYLHIIEREAHRRLAPFRYRENREFFKTSIEQADDVMTTLRKEALQNLDKGLTPIGGPTQERIVEAPKETKRFLKPPQHWHVWNENLKDEEERVIRLQLDPRTYWTKSGCQQRVKRDVMKGTFSIFTLCNDKNCPDFGMPRPKR